MKQFVAQLTDDKHINVRADRMEIYDDVILAFDGEELVAVVNRSVFLTAHISEKAEATPQTAPPMIPEPVKEDPPPKPIPPKEPSHEPAETGYKGFLYIKCEQCGSTKGFCVKQPIRESRCDCGHLTELRGLKPLYLNCKCGEFFKYRTNLTEKAASMNCIHCGSPVDLELHEKNGAYETIGFEKEN